MRACFALFLLLQLAAPAAADDKAQVERTFLERAAITAADKRCNLFSDGERLALGSGYYQAQGELLRAGRRQREIDSLVTELSSRSRSISCDHPEVRSVAAAIRDSYRQFQKVSYQEYPGVTMLWGASRSANDKWALRQQDKASGVIFGVHRYDPGGEKPEEMRLALSIPAAPGERAPPSARLFIRDPAKLDEPWLGGLFGASATPTPPPRSLTRPEWASEMKTENEAKKDFRRVIYFADKAIDRLDLLDPREAIEIEIAPSPYEPNAKPLRYVFELGDFHAARLFAAIPEPAYAAPDDAKATKNTNGKVASARH